MSTPLETLASALTLGDLLLRVRALTGSYEIVAHWQQGEFHHDVVLRLSRPIEGAGPVLVVSTNCNGGVKEVLAMSEVPDRDALWRHRCGQARGEPMLGEIGRARTVHWFDPCELLGDDARSELLPEFRERQPGGGWQMKRQGGACGKATS